MTRSQILKALDLADVSDLARALAAKRDTSALGGFRPGAGRKRSDAPRCACGAMTAKLAAIRRHVCAGLGVADLAK
jgi:hypothetical protein